MTNNDHKFYFTLPTAYITLCETAIQSTLKALISKSCHNGTNEFTRNYNERIHVIRELEVFQS